MRLLDDGRSLHHLRYALRSGGRPDFTGAGKGKIVILKHKK